MERSAPARGTGEAGFLLAEAVVAVALIAVCAGAALAAAAAMTRATAHALPAASLTLTAQNILTDLRAATAYDPVQLAALAGKSAAFDVDEPGQDRTPRRIHIETGVSRSAQTDAYTAIVTATAIDGATVTIQATLVQEAPAPGSVLPAETPPPYALGSPSGHAADTGSASDQIPL